MDKRKVLNEIILSNNDFDLQNQEKTKDELIIELQELRQTQSALKASYNADVASHEQLEELLRESLDKFKKLSLLEKTILESADGIIVFALDREYCYLEFTLLHKQTMKAIWGAEIEIGSNMLAFISNESDREKAKKNFDRALAGDKFFVEEVYGDEKLNRTYYEDRYNPVFDSNNTIIGIAVFVIDITELKLVEEKLKESELKYKTVADFTCDWEFWLSPENEYIYISPSCQRITGCTPDDFINNPDLLNQLIHHDDLRAYQEHHHSVHASKDSNKIDFRIINLQGEIRWISHICQPVFDENGNFSGIRGSNRDITNRKHTELLLRKKTEVIESQYEESRQINNELTQDNIQLQTARKKAKKNEERYLNLLANLETGIVVHAPDTSIVTNNHRASVLLGLSDAQLKGKVAIDPEWKFVTENHTPLALEEYPVNRIVSGRKLIRNQVLGIHQPGKNDIVWVTVNGFPAFDNTGEISEIVISFNDITDRKLAEEALKLSEERFKKMFNEAPLGIALIDSLTGHIYEVNPMFAKIAGRTMAEMEQIDWMSITHPDDIKEDLDNMAKMNAGKTPGFSMEKRYLHKDGTAVWIYMTIAPLNVEDKAHPCHLCMIEDITDRKKSKELIIANKALNRLIAESRKTQNELFKRDQESRAMLQNNPDIVGRFDKNFRYLYINHPIPTVNNSSAKEVIGNTIHERGFPEDLVSFFEQSLQYVFATGKEKTTVTDYHINGNLQYYESRWTPEFAPDGSVATALCISRDITVIKEAENKLILANKELTLKNEETEKRAEELMIANKNLEQFAYIASHDLQEPLRTISNYMQVFEEDYLMLLDDNGKKHLQAVKAASNRMSILIKSLLDFSRLGGNFNLNEVDCNQLLADVIADLKTIIQTSNAVIEVTDMPKLKIFEPGIRQLFQNLIINAIKFQRKDNQPKIQIRSEKIDTKWKFSITDNGIGIDPVHFEKIFEIFQCLHTDAKYEGKGIGLASCKKIVQLHHGEIWVESSLGKGTTFNFTIPN